MKLNWLIRMSLWARNPPPMWKVKLVVGIVLICLVIYGIEQIWGWPEYLTMEKRGRYVAP